MNIGIYREVTQPVTPFSGDRFAGQVHPMEHHLAHLSSAFHVSPVEAALVVSVDSFGGFASAAWGVGRGTHIEVEDKVGHGSPPARG
jgi:carbamoyltransferase